MIFLQKKEEGVLSEKYAVLNLEEKLLLLNVFEKEANKKENRHPIGCRFSRKFIRFYNLIKATGSLHAPVTEVLPRTLKK